MSVPSSSHQQYRHGPVAAGYKVNKSYWKATKIAFTGEELEVEVFVHLSYDKSQEHHVIELVRELLTWTEFKSREKSLDQALPEYVVEQCDKKQQEIDKWSKTRSCIPFLKGKASVIYEESPEHT